MVALSAGLAGCVTPKLGNGDGEEVEEETANGDGEVTSDIEALGSQDQEGGNVETGDLEMSSPEVKEPTASAESSPSPSAGLPDLASDTNQSGDVSEEEILGLVEFQEVKLFEPYRFRIRDPVYISMPTTLGELNLMIDEKGNITLPYIDKLRAEGSSSSELEEAIIEAYVPDYFRAMSVNVMAVTQRNYYISGYVARPGKYPYIGGITLMQAIDTAGGLSLYANRKKIYITRAGQTKRYDTNQITKNPVLDVTLEAGDRIVVGRGYY